MLTTILDFCSTAAELSLTVLAAPQAEPNALSAQWAEVVVAKQALLATWFVGAATLVLATVAILVPWLQRRADRHREDSAARSLSIEALKAVVVAAKSVGTSCRFVLQADKVRQAGGVPDELRRLPEDGLAWASETLRYYLNRHHNDLNVVQALAAAHYETRRVAELIVELNGDAMLTSERGQRLRELLRRTSNDALLMERLAEAQGAMLGVSIVQLARADDEAMSSAMGRTGDQSLIVVGDGVS